MRIGLVIAGAAMVIIAFIAPGILDFVGVTIAGNQLFENIVATLFTIIGGYLLIRGMFGS